MKYLRNWDLNPLMKIKITLIGHFLDITFDLKRIVMNHKESLMTHLHIFQLILTTLNLK